MKIITSILWLAFFLVFGVFAYTQEPSDTKKPQQQEEQKPEAKSKQMKPEQQGKPEQEAKPSDAKPSREAKPEAKGKEERPQTEEQPQREEGAKHPQAEHPQAESQPHAAQAGQGRQAGKGGHIPDDKFHSSFGRQHTFVISRPVIVDNQPRFQYGGYWFEIVGPWPEDWAYTDDCYVDYVDGDYFLFDSLHPAERVAIIVVM